MAARSHHWHLHLVATSGQSLSARPLHCGDGGKARAYVCQCAQHSSRLITEKTAARPEIQRGVVSYKGNPHSISERFSGRHSAAAGAAAGGSGQICFISPLDNADHPSLKERYRYAGKPCRKGLQADTRLPRRVDGGTKLSCPEPVSSDCRWPGPESRTEG